MFSNLIIDKVISFIIQALRGDDKILPAYNFLKEAAVKKLKRQRPLKKRPFL